MKKLTETSIFQYVNTEGDDLIKKIGRFSQEGAGTVYLTGEDMRSAFYSMREKSFPFKSKFALITLFDKGIIKLVYNESHKLPVAIPFFKVKDKYGGWNVVVNISNFASISKTGEIKINPNTLFSLMLAGALSLTIDKSIGGITDGIPDLYAGMATNVISRMANLDKIKRSKIEFIFTKFFYMQLGTDELKASQRAIKDLRFVDESVLTQIDLRFPATAYEDIDSLLQNIKQVFPEFTKLNLATFFDRWLMGYGEIGAFSIEFIPFFYMVVIALMAKSVEMINFRSIETLATSSAKEIERSFERIENTIMQIAKR